MSTEPEILSSDRPSTRTRRRLLVAGVAAAAVAVGGAVTAAAASAPSPSASGSAAPSPSASGSAAPKGERQHTPHLAGTVVSAAGNTITITDHHGFQRTIHTTGDTEYADGLTATPAAGTKIFATGTVDSDKVSLLATRVGKLPDRAADGGHRGGPGGPGGRHGDRPDEPSGSGTPSPGTPSPTPSPSPTR